MKKEVIEILGESLAVLHIVQGGQECTIGTSNAYSTKLGKGRIDSLVNAIEDELKKVVED